MPKDHNSPVPTDLNKIVDLHKARPLSESKAKPAVETVLKKYARLGVENAKLRLDHALAKVESLESNKTMKTCTGKEHKVSESFVQDVQTHRNAVAGRLKTANKQADRLRGLITQKPFVLGGHAKRLQTAITALEGHRDGMEAALKNAERAFDELKKRVGQK